MPDPPIPADVMLLEQDADVDGNTCSFGLWLFAPGASSAGETWARAVFDSFVLAISGSLLNCCHLGVSLTTCRIVVGGTPTLRYSYFWGPNHGAWQGGQSQAVAVGLYIATLSGGRGSGSRVHLPGTPDLFVDNDTALSIAGHGNLVAFGSDLVAWASGLTSPGGASVQLGTLKRRDNGVPLPVASFDPMVAVFPMLRIARTGRRMPRTGRVSPD